MPDSSGTLRPIDASDPDHGLLSVPGLMALILHRTQRGPASLDDLGAALAAEFAAARETPGASSETMRERLRAALRDLEVARLVEADAEGRFALTDRGREALVRNPEGVDPSVLVGYPEYLAHVSGSARGRTAMDPREGSFDQGYSAGRAGLPLTDNPHPPASVDHQSWENGWMQAKDDMPRR